jgi:hypothetical protein
MKILHNSAAYTLSVSAQKRTQTPRYHQSHASIAVAYIASEGYVQFSEDYLVSIARFAFYDFE